MNIGIPGITDDLRTQRFYHGTRAHLKPEEGYAYSTPLARRCA
jgi:hypothetical protein